MTTSPLTAPTDPLEAPTGAPTAIVTGGSSGIGRALAEALSATGLTVVVADRQVRLAESVVAGIRMRGGHARVAELDVRDPRQFAEIVTTTFDATGRLDYLFNNAGIGVVGEMCYYGPSDWSDVLDVNLAGVCNGIAAAYPRMVRQRFGHIVNTASVAGLVPTPMIGSYTASKFAVVGLSRALRLEAKRHGIRVSVVCPAIVDTPLLRGGHYSRVNDDAEPLREHARKLHVWASDPDTIARRVLRAVALNRAVIVEPPWARGLWYLDRLSPWATEQLCGRLLSRVLPVSRAAVSSREPQ